MEPAALPDLPAVAEAEKLDEEVLKMLLTLERERKRQKEQNIREFNKIVEKCSEDASKEVKERAEAMRKELGRGTAPLPWEASTKKRGRDVRGKADGEPEPKERKK